MAQAAPQEYPRLGQTMVKPSVVVIAKPHRKEKRCRLEGKWCRVPASNGRVPLPCLRRCGRDSQDHNMYEWYPPAVAW